MFTNIHGHQRPLSYLRALLSSDKDLPSCFLFHGPTGVGKRTVAFSVARALNCHENQDAKCSCLSCKKIRGGHHVDVRYYEPEGTTFKVDQVRDLLVEADHPRSEGKYRIFIISKAHTLNAQAADALLKTLEDGRKNVLFILLASSKDRIIPTLASRAMDFYFGYLSEEQVASVLTEQGYTEVTVRTAAHLSGGSVDKALFYMEGKGLIIRSEILNLLREYPHVKDYKVLETLAPYEDLTEFVEVMYSVLSDVCQIQSGLTTFLDHRDREDLLLEVSDTFGPKCFNAHLEIRSLRDRMSSVAFDHHVKSTLLSFKDLLRT